MCSRRCWKFNWGEIRVAVKNEHISEPISVFLYWGLCKSITRMWGVLRCAPNIQDDTVWTHIARKCTDLAKIWPVWWMQGIQGCFEKGPLEEITCESKTKIGERILRCGLVHVLWTDVSWSDSEKYWFCCITVQIMLPSVTGISQDERSNSLLLPRVYEIFVWLFLFTILSWIFLPLLNLQYSNSSVF